MDFHPCKSSGGLPVNVHFKIRAPLLDAIRGDLRRRHAFAYERVGWISAGVSRIGDGSLFLLAQDYHPVEVADYIDDPRVGAMLGSQEIRKGMPPLTQSRDAEPPVHQQ